MYSENDWRQYSEQELQHHGIMGQRWGQRNGPPYPLSGSQKSASEKRATSSSSDSSGSGRTKAQQAIDNDGADYDDVVERMKAVTADCLTSESLGWNEVTSKSTSKNGKRAREAADLGLKAIDKMRGPGYIDDPDNPDDGDRQWFWFEDQTIGMGMVADLVNQGYTKKDIAKLAKICDKNSDDFYDRIDKGGSDSHTEEAVFGLTEGNWGGELETFAGHCEEIKKNSKKSSASTSTSTTTQTDEAKEKSDRYWKEHNKIERRAEVGKKVGTVVGGTVGAAAGIAADIGLSAVSGYIFPYLQVMMPVAGAMYGATAGATIADAYKDVKLTKLNKKYYG